MQNKVVVYFTSVDLFQTMLVVVKIYWSQAEQFSDRLWLKLSKEYNYKVYLSIYCIQFGLHI